MFFKSKLTKEDYQTELDRFFHDFDQKRKEFPQSRIHEIKKHQAIFERRDHPVEELESTLWSGF